MKKLKIPARANSGAMQFGSDWPGVFMRGDDALFQAAFLEELTRKIENGEEVHQFDLLRLQQLTNSLQACGYRKDMTVQKMRHIEECFIEQQLSPEDQKIKAEIEAALARDMREEE